MQRRSFINGACRICILGVSGMALLESCSPSVAKALAAEKPVVKDNKLELPLSMFDAKPVQIISPDKFEYEIAVEKRPDNTFRALLLKCTHYENPLIITGNGYVCTSHGSKFDKSGKVLNGPASANLNELKTTIIKSNLSIQL